MTTAALWDGGEKGSLFPRRQGQQQFPCYSTSACCLLLVISCICPLSLTLCKRGSCDNVTDIVIVCLKMSPLNTTNGPAEGVEL